MEAKDIVLEDNNDLTIEDGDFKIAASDEQSIQLIINSWVGNWKQYPLVGTGIRSFVGSSGQSLAIKKTISIQLAYDGFSDISVKVSNTDNTDIIVDAIRK